MRIHFLSALSLKNLEDKLHLDYDSKTLKSTTKLWFTSAVKKQRQNEKFFVNGLVTRHQLQFSHSNHGRVTLALHLRTKKPGGCRDQMIVKCEAFKLLYKKIF